VEHASSEVIERVTFSLVILRRTLGEIAVVVVKVRPSSASKEPVEIGPAEFVVKPVASHFFRVR
jgi:hypothetical protein